MSRTRTSRTRGSRRAASLVLGLLVTLAVPVAGAGAAEEGTNPNLYELFAQANAVSGFAATLALPVVQETTAGPYGATAAASSSGVVTANAGAPFSPFLFSLPGTVSGATGGAVNVPTPPGFVEAAFPANPETKSDQPAYTLSATTSAQAAAGEAVVRPQGAGEAAPQNGYALATTAANPDGSVTVRAVARVDSFEVEGVVELSRIVADYTFTLQPSGSSTVTADVQLGAITLVGTTSGPTKDGLTVAGMPLPVTRETLNMLSPQLAEQGVTVGYAPTTFGYADGSTSSGDKPESGKTLQSVSFGGLVVGGKGAAPGQDSVEGVTTLADVHLSATNIADASPTFTGEVDAVDLPAPVFSGADATFDTDASVGTTSDAVPSFDDGLSGGDLAAAPDAVAPAPQTAEEVGPGQARVVRAAAAPAVSIESFYLVLVLAAALAFGSSQLVRFLAVRRAAGSWGSASQVSS